MAGTPTHATRADLLARLDAVEQRLNRLVATPTPGLTEPDEATGERWEAGQVWAHIAEFVPYWMRQLDIVVTRSQGSAPDEGSRTAPSRPSVSFGRTRADPTRIAAIERDRRQDPRALLRRAGEAIARARSFMHQLPPSDWAALGRHPTRGDMDVAAILDDFVVGHLEEHADQLDGLAGAVEPRATR